MNMKTELTDEQKQQLRVKVAELCGAKYYQSGGGEVFLMARKPANALWREVAKPLDFQSPDGVPNFPNYTGSLDAMHEAEKLLTPAQCYVYQNNLERIFGEWRPQEKSINWLFHATATQRALAFVRTMEGKV